MDLGLAGKVAIVTGGGSGGLGYTMAQRLLEEGAKVLAVDLDEAGNRSMVEELSKVGEIRGHIADLATVDFAEPAVAAAAAAFGGVDILVQNAGTYPSHKWDEYTVEEWDRTLDVNLRAQWLLAKAAVPSMQKRGGGAIVNIGSITMLVGLPMILPYVASKAGVAGFTRALAREVGVDNIRVNTVAPGAFPTGGETIHPDPEGYSKWVIEQQSLKRRGTRDDLANIVVFLCSDRSSFVTGQMVLVDGGWMHW